MEELRKKILIVDDNEINRVILCDMLEDEFDLVEAEDGLQAVEIIKEQADSLTLVLLDLIMPKLDGFGVLSAMRENNWIDGLPVIMISADTGNVSMRRAFELGAVDYISRPFDQVILRKRIQNTIILYGRQRNLADYVAEQIQAREHDSALMVAILSHIVEFRNGESGKHVQHINTITDLLIDKILGKTDKYSSILTDRNLIKMASSLHDIGKIGIPEAILNKPGRLTKEEFEVMKTHSILGARTMEQLFEFQDEPLVKYSYQICRWHHERWDGKGYPDGLEGDNIPIAAQIVSLADVYDALTSKRCYKDAYTHEKALEMIKNGECGTFNPLLIECLMELDGRLQNELDKPLVSLITNKDMILRDIQRRMNQ